MRPLAFAIHDLNPWGGHDRSTLEIARRLSHRWPVDIYSFTLEDPQGLESWGKVRFHRIRPHIRRPALAKISYFYGATLPLLSIVPRLGRGPAPVVHATGTCSLLSDVVQVQFVHAAWQSRIRELPREAGGASSAGRELYHELLLRYNVAVERKVYSRRKTYIAIAEGVANELRGHFGIESGIHVIHHGVDSTVFRPAGDPERARREDLRASLGISESDVVFAFVGAYARKGLGPAIDALARLSPGCRAITKILAVGNGPVSELASRARAAGVEDRVIFVSHQKNIVPYYQASDAFLLPTLYEPFGLVILEAMACGLAPVVSRLAGASELIREGESGSLIDDPSDPAEIARRMERVAGQRELRARMGAEARKVALMRSWDQVAGEYAAVLEPLLNA